MPSTITLKLHFSRTHTTIQYHKRYILFCLKFIYNFVRLRISLFLSLGLLFAGKKTTVSLTKTQQLAALESVMHLIDSVPVGHRATLFSATSCL